MGAPLIGARVPRKEDYRFLTGAGQYTDDVTLPRQTFAAFVRSPHAHAKIKSVNTAKAKAAPGVLGVYTGEDIAAAKLGGLPCGWLITDVNGQPMKEPPYPVIAQGKVRHVGVSNFTPAQVDMLASWLPVPLVTNQVELHPLRLQPFLDGTLDQCLRLRMAPMAWSPLAGGRLVNGQGEAELRVQSVLAKLRRKYGADLDQLVYEIVLFDGTGGVAAMTLFDFGQVPRDGLRARQFDVPATRCADLSGILVNGVAACSVAGAASDVCRGATELGSRSGIEVLR